MPVVLKRMEKIFLQEMMEYFDNLPQDYLSFYEKYNGLIITDPDYLDIEFSTLNGLEISFDAILEVSSENDSYDLITINKELGDDLPNSIFIIIGSDPGGNFFIMNKDNSNIFYWDRTIIHSELDVDFIECDIGNIYSIELKFSNFIDLILEKCGENNIDIQK